MSTVIFSMNGDKKISSFNRPDGLILKEKTVTEKRKKKSSCHRASGLVQSTFPQNPPINILASFLSQDWKSGSFDFYSQENYCILTPGGQWIG
jgi:hypothetical protein